MAQVRRTKTARRDLLQIWQYIAQDNSAAADQLLARIEERSRQLASHPRAGTPRDDLAPGLRSYAVGRYLVFYNTIADGIEIVRVLHGARDIERLWRDA